MKILQSVKIKQILTEKSKQKILNKYKQSKLKLKKECEQLLFELRKMERSRKYSQSGLKIQFDKEIENRKEKIKMIDFQIEQLDMLPLGSELLEHEIQELVEIQVGDNWEERSKGKTIVIKDGIIVEIRER